MKTAFLALLLVPLSLLGYRYEPLLLRTEAKLAPRILLMTEGVSYFAPNRFTICIVSEQGDAAAEQFKNYLLGYYPNGWQYHTMQIALSDFESMESECKESEMIFVLSGSDAAIRHAAAYAAATHKVSMSYSNAYLQMGILVSLHIGKDVKPYLNINQAKAAGFRFDNNLKRVSKFWYVKTDRP